MKPNFLQTRILFNLVTILGTLIFSVEGLAAGDNPPTRIAGTDLFVGPIAESILVSGKSLDLQAEWIGSYKAIQKLRSGKVDLAIVSSTSRSSLPKLPEMQILPLAYRMSRVIVAKDNPMSEVSLSQLKSIFGSRANLRMETWGQLGLDARWGAQAITPMVPRRFTTFSPEVFELHVLPGNRFHSAVKVFPDEQELIKAFPNDPGAIAVLSSLRAEEFGKALPIVFGDGQSFGATPENLYFGDYPLQMPFSLLFPRSRIKELLPLVRVIYSSEVAQAIFQGGLAPVPDDFRKAELKKLGAN